MVQARQAEAQAEAEASFAIPESLRLQEGESEAEYDRKRKKVKALKVKLNAGRQAPLLRARPSSPLLGVLSGLVSKADPVEVELHGVR